MHEDITERTGKQDAPPVSGVAASSGLPELDGDLAVAERAVSALAEAWEASVSAAGSTIPPVQLRAVLAIDAAAPVSLTALANQLRASTSAASRLCDRLQQAGLIIRDHAVQDGRGVLLSLTPAGANFAAWVREQRRTRLAAVLAGLRPDARRTLIDGLRELPATTAGGDLQPAPASSGQGGGTVGSPARMDGGTINRWARDPAGLFTGADGSVGRSLSALTWAVSDRVPFCCGASATLWEPDAVVAMGASSADLAAVAEQQFLAGDGPIIAALKSGEPEVTPDILREDRWPEFAVASLAAGVRSQTTVVYDYSLMTLSLSLYSAVTGALDVDGLSPSALTGLGAAAMAGAAEEGRVQRTAEQLDAAIRSRAVVEQARELVMQQLGCGPDEAFERLWRIAQQQRRKVTKVAQRMVMASEAPEAPGSTI